MIQIRNAVSRATVGHTMFNTSHTDRDVCTTRVLSTPMMRDGTKRSCSDMYNARQWYKTCVFSPNPSGFLIFGLLTAARNDDDDDATDSEDLLRPWSASRQAPGAVKCAHRESFNNTHDETILHHHQQQQHDGLEKSKALTLQSNQFRIKTTPPIFLRMDGMDSGMWNDVVWFEN
jgi:hypothetical protein